MFERDELEGVAFIELTGNPFFRILQSAGTLHCDGWNRTQVMPNEDKLISDIQTKGYQLLWTAPPENHLDLPCMHEVNVSGKLFMVSEEQIISLSLSLGRSLSHLHFPCLIITPALLLLLLLLFCFCFLCLPFPLFLQKGCKLVSR
jgi:hypothetical protein